MAISNIVESIELIETDFTYIDNLISVNLSKGQNYENCVPFFTQRGNSIREQGHLVDVYFSGTTESGILNFRRYRSDDYEFPGVTTYYVDLCCYVIEFNPSQIRVQQGTFSLSSTSTTTSIPATLNDVNKAALVHTWRMNADSTTRQGRYTFVGGEIVNTSTVGFYLSLYTKAITGHWYIFEDLGNNFEVEHISEVVANLTTPYYNIFDDIIDPFRTFFLSSLTGGNNANNDDSSARLFYLGKNTIAFDNFSGSINNAKFFLQVVTFLDKSKIYVPFNYSVRNYLQYTDTPIYSSANYTVEPESNSTPFNINLDSTVAINASMQGISSVGRESWGSTGGYNYSFSYVKHTSSSGISFSTLGTYMCVDPSTSFLIDWAGIEVDYGSNYDPIPVTSGAGVKSVENFRATLSDIAGHTVLTKAQDYRNCALFTSCTQGPGTDSRLYSPMVDVYLVPSGIVCYNMPDTRFLADAYIDVSVVEFWPEQVKVQQVGAVYQTTTGNYDITIPDEVSDINKCFITHKQNIYRGYTRSPENWFTRVELYDTDTIRLYRADYYNSTAEADGYGYYCDFTMFLVEDLASNFVTRHYTGSDTGSSYLSSSDFDVEFASSNTFILGSVAPTGANLNQAYIQIGLLSESSPVFLSQYSSTTYYWAITLVKFITGKIHVDQQCVDFTSTTTVSGNYSSYFAGHTNSITAFNTNQVSAVAMDWGQSTQIYSAFGTIRIMDYDTRYYQAYRRSNWSDGSNDEDSKAFFNIVDWIGYDYLGENNIDLTIPNTTDTKAAVKSLQVNNYYTDLHAIEVYLEHGQNIEQCVLFVSSSAYTDSMNLALRCINRFDNGFVIRHLNEADKNRYTINDRHITSYIVEFNDSVTIQYGTVIMDSTSVTVNIDSVDLDRAFLYFSHSNSDQYEREGQVKYAMTCGRFLDETTLEFNRYSSSYGVTNISWYVIECTAEDDFWEVEHSYFTSKAGLAYSLEYSPPIYKDKTLIFFSYTINTDWYPAGVFYNVGFDTNHNPSYLDLTRLQANDQIQKGNVELVRFSEGSNFISRIVNISIATTHSGTASLDRSFNTDMSMIVISPASGASANSDRTDNWAGLQDECFFNYSFLDSTTVIARKINSADTNNGVCIACELPYNSYYFDGYVQEVIGGYRPAPLQPVSRDLYMYRADTGTLMDQTTSVSGTGYFYLETSYSGAHYIVCKDDVAGIDYNDLIYGQLYPTVISGCFAHYMGWVDSSLAVGTPVFRQ